MQDFVVLFLISNLFLAAFVGLILAVKRIFRRQLSCRMQYHMWFFLLAALTVPFLPLPPNSLYRLFFWLVSPAAGSLPQGTKAGIAFTGETRTETVSAFHDFTVSVSGRAPSALVICLILIWLIGLMVMLVLLLRSRIYLYRLERSALLLQNPEIKRLFQDCLGELKVRRRIAVYSTPYLKSPVTLGIFRPRIYLPLHLISDCSAKDMRYILLHELQHYRHGDALIGCLMSIAGLIYWFNPAVRQGLRKMRDDRELACDSSVLELLDESEYPCYGNTLLQFAEKISHCSFPFAAGMGGDFRQIKKRIVNIASFRPAARSQKLKGRLAYLVIAAALIGAAPVLSANALGEEDYTPAEKGPEFTSLDLSAYFGEYDGSFVLYDTKADSWKIYNQELAVKRISPDSTYKIYSALMGLEAGSISAGSSELTWDGTEYPFAEWNQNQDLATAMQNSVNWYFQHLDRRTGKDTVQSYLSQIRYGNEDTSAGLESCWLESSLKISPLEQAELLKKLLAGELPFRREYIQTVQDALLVRSDDSGRLYGKTGTGAVDGMEVNGWFVGFTESAQGSYVFALNIQGNSNATGTHAKEIALRILQDM